MFQRVRIESGQYLVPVETLELDRDRFRVLVDACIQTYSKQHPVELKYNLDITSRSFTFVAGTIADGNTIGIPQDVLDIVPITIAGLSPFFLREFEERTSRDLDDKVSFPWEYRQQVNTLFVPIQGRYDISSIHDHIIREEGDTASTKEFFVDTITFRDDAFFKLLQGKFLMALAHSRRAFTLQDLPILTDAAELVGDAKLMIEEATTSLNEEESKWWLAWG